MNRTVETRYRVSGMKCGGCIAKATEAVSKLPGYVSAEFDLKNGTAVVRGGVDPQSVVNALTKVGYPAEADEG
ncbi:MAG: heavy-metal-associated domain-containing protein [Gammaproteobacteria bacterium]|nr:heavy-metal-associated domain-containing protein [Gammaproteobacteria bacterium]